MANLEPLLIIGGIILLFGLGFIFLVERQDKKEEQKLKLAGLWETRYDLTVEIIGGIISKMYYSDPYSDAQASYLGVPCRVIKQGVRVGLPRFTIVPLERFPETPVIGKIYEIKRYENDV